MEYIESIVLINITIHLLFVKISSYMLGIKTNKICLCLSILLDSIYVVLYLLVPYKIERFKYGFLFLISVLPFLKQKIGSGIGFIFYLGFNMTLGGVNEILYSISSYTKLYLVLSILALYFTGVFISFRLKTFQHDKLYYSIRISHGGKKYTYTAYLDTGNFLKYDFIPVVFLSSKDLLNKKFKTIQISGAINSSLIDLYTVDSFEIKMKGRYVKRDVYVAYANISYEALISLKTIGG